MKEPKLLSNKQIRKQRKALLKRLRKSYKVAHAAWQAMNYYDVYFDERIADKLGMTFEQFEAFQKTVVNALSQYCKIRQEHIFELINSETL
jgi:predicted aminopeptidase